MMELDEGIDPRLRRQVLRLRALSDITLSIASERDLERIVQRATDAATGLSGAKFGAFFYNVVDGDGERYQLYTISGAARAAFERFGLPRKTAIFEPTFAGTSVIRSDDIRADPRYGKNPPHQGMPKGHLPVVSYLAVPVMSLTGEVMGGMFLGHDAPAVFDAAAEEFVIAIAAHTAAAIDNLRQFGKAHIEIEQRRLSEMAARRLAAIVESSQDPIVAKDLDGIISSWNQAAERLFGYTAAEMIGKPITILIPPDRLAEEDMILARLRRGERIESYETMRRCKDGSLVPVLLTISPIKDGEGKVVGASKIARDISERRQAEARQQLLIEELHHRVKNAFALASSIVTLGSRSAETARELAAATRERLAALSRVQNLTLPEHSSQSGADPRSSLQAIANEVISPLDVPRGGGGSRFSFVGDDLQVCGNSITALALMLNELASNAVKYGALSTPTGKVSLECAALGDAVRLVWRESGGPPIAEPPAQKGFGSGMLDRTVQAQFGGTIEREWLLTGLVARIAFAREHLEAGASRAA